jgi:hypothetical protein
MTRALRLALCGLLVACCSGQAAWSEGGGGPAPARPALPELPAGVVAQVYGPAGEVLAELTVEKLQAALVFHVLPDLKEAGSAPMTILRELIEETLVEQEAAALGIRVTDADIQAYVSRLDAELRSHSGGQQSLAELRKARGMTWETFRTSVAILLRKERIASHAKWLGKLPTNDRQRMSQVSVVVTELHKRAKIVWHVAVADMFLQQAGQKEAEAGPAGALVTVNGRVIDHAQYGKALFERLPDDILKEVVDKECATKLLQVDSLALDEAGMEAELQLRERNWPVQRTLLSQTEWHKVGYEEFLKATLKMTRAELKADRYFRSYYGLVRREREKLTDAMLEEEWKVKSQTVYGPAILLDALQIGFERKNALLAGGGGGRDRAQALAIAHEVLSQVARGQPFDLVAKDVATRRKDPRTGGPDPTLRSGERRVYNTQADQLLFNEASKLKDGEVSPAPIETLSEVHLLRRKRMEPGPSYATVKEILRETMAGGRAQLHMVNSAKDPTRVRVRWPLRTP